MLGGDVTRDHDKVAEVELEVAGRVLYQATNSRRLRLPGRSSPMLKVPIVRAPTR